MVPLPDEYPTLLAEGKKLPEAIVFLTIDKESKTFEE